MSSSITLGNYAPEFKGYRIRQQTANDQVQDKKQFTMVKVIVKNQTGGIPKIRHDVICNGKHYPFIPLFSFTSQNDLGILDQISTIVLRDQNEILCEILSQKVTQIKTNQFKDIKQRFRSVFALELKVDLDELFMILMSDQVTDDDEFNAIFDSVTETQFVNVLKKLYENCPDRLIPKILRKITKYFNSTKGREVKSIERLKRLLKLIKSVDEGSEVQQKQVPSKKSIQTPKKSVPKQEEKQQKTVRNETPKINKETKKEAVLPQVPAKVQQKPRKKTEQAAIVSKPVVQKPVVQKPKQSIKVISKETETVKKTQKVTKKQKFKTVQKTIQPQKEAASHQNQQDWKDVDESHEEDEQIKKHIGKMAFKADESDEDLKYVGPKKKNKKKGNDIVPIEPEFDANLSRKAQRLKKQNKYQGSNSPSLQNTVPVKDRRTLNAEENAEDDIVGQRMQQKKSNSWQTQRKNGSGNDQSLEKGRREFSREKRVDPRILLGITGASDLVWRQRLRPNRYPKDQNGNEYRGQAGKQNKPNRVKTVQQNESPKKQSTFSQPAQLSKNLALEKIFSIPEDIKQGKVFKFQKRNYNLLVNKLFWVNIIEGQVTIQKEGKGYIRKCTVEIIDNGNGIMADGITLNIDGLSNLEDGGTAFGDPVFQEFTPDGQWFHISALDVYAYV